MSADKTSRLEQEGDDGKQPKREIILALIEYASRPLATVFVSLLAVLWLFFMRGALFQLLANTESVKVGSFEIQLREQAHYEDLGDQLRALKNLTPDQLELFLIVGKEREHISYFGPELTEANLQALKSAGLLSEFYKQPNNQWFWRVSDNGFALQRLIFGLLTAAIKGSG
ncbi:MAG: hypothetical protein JO166_16075 [Deltaproteobacteria bacterium]|nr:hypothetical protein [Deltaproteobacteria bacterium]